MKRSRLTKQRAEDSSFDLDLAPMLSMMVVLIPILLLSVIFVRVTVIDTPVPQVVSKAMKKDMEKKDRTVDIKLEMRANRSFLVKVIKNGKVTTTKVDPQNNEFDYEKLHTVLVDLKLKHPEVFKVNFYPAEELEYQDIVKAVDAARDRKKDDPKIFLVDEQTKEKVEHNVLFPNVIFSDVVEG